MKWWPQSSNIQRWVHHLCSFSTSADVIHLRSLLNQVEDEPRMRGKVLCRPSPVFDKFKAWRRSLFFVRVHTIILFLGFAVPLRHSPLSTAVSTKGLPWWEAFIHSRPVPFKTHMFWTLLMNIESPMPQSNLPPPKSIGKIWNITIKNKLKHLQIYRKWGCVWWCRTAFHIFPR